MVEQYLDQGMERVTMTQKLIKVNLHTWNIIRSIFSYISANYIDYQEFDDLKEEFEKRVGKIEWKDDENYIGYIPLDIFNKLKKIAIKISKEEWNEYSIITPFSLEELKNAFK